MYYNKWSLGSLSAFVVFRSCRVGEYDQALTLLSRAKAIEEKELGGRYERVASLLYEIAYAKSEARLVHPGLLTADLRNPLEV